MLKFFNYTYIDNDFPELLFDVAAPVAVPYLL
jgi:hypothetical protein